MPIAKRIGLAILSPLFIFLLFATAFDIGFVRTATHPAAVKRLVSESGIYNSVIPNVLARTKSISTSLGDVPTSDPDIQKAARAALPPQYIQQNTEMAIDNIYQWLDGKIDQPNFNIDLSGAKTLFANNIADSVQKRLAALPPCTAAQSLEVARSGNFDAYNAACLPRSISPAAIAEQLKAGVINQQDFIKNLDINAASVKDSRGQPVFEQNGVKSIPAQYQRAKKTPAILIILTILAGTGIVLLSRNRLAGLRLIGINLLVVGLVMLLFSWGLNRAVNKNIIPKIKVDSAIFQQDIRSLVSDLTRQIDRNYWFFGGLYAGLGLTSLASAQVIMRRQGRGSRDNKAAEYQHSPQRSAGPSSPPPEPKPD